jgi:hypothetical protein
LNNRPWVGGNNAVRFYEIKKVFTIRFNNNSEHDAYRLKLLKPLSQDCSISPNIDYLKPLKKNESDSFDLTFTSIHEVTHAAENKNIR